MRSFWAPYRPIVLKTHWVLPCTCFVTYSGRVALPRRTYPVSVGTGYRNEHRNVRERPSMERGVWNGTVTSDGQAAIKASIRSTKGLVMGAVSGLGRLGRQYLRPAAAWTTWKSAWPWPETTGWWSPRSDLPDRQLRRIPTLCGWMSQCKVQWRG